METIIEAIVVAIPISATTTIIIRPPGIRAFLATPSEVDNLMAAPNKNRKGANEETIIISINNVVSATDGCTALPENNQQSNHNGLGPDRKGRRAGVRS